jgi:catechol 2,3-dioxygenase-like lactoylglutathione lyase family enzyme
MAEIAARFLGAGFYFDNLDEAKTFYSQTLGLKLADHQPGHFAKFDSGTSFVTLEQKGSETYPSKDKATLFFVVPDLEAAKTAIGVDRFVQSEANWAVLHDPEGHNILLLQRDSSQRL